jgi:hypothetical protein
LLRQLAGIMATPADREQKRHTWPRRVALWVGIALIGFELIYLVAANLILRTHSLDGWVTGATKGLYLRINSGWTVLPGRVHLEGVELRFEDYNVQFAVMLEKGTVDIALFQLPAKTFHLTRVRAEGVRYHFRHRVHSAKGNERRLALYPKIPGYSDPPLYEGPPTPPLTDEQYDLWTIHLEDVEANATELWFLEYRFSGRARARGGFRLEPERDAQTERCTLALDGALHVGQQPVASKLAGWLHAQLDRHDPRRVPGAQIFAKISVNTELDAAIPDLEFTELYRSDGGIELSRGTGTVHARAQLEHGAWMENTAIHYETAGITVAKKPLVVAGPLELDAEIAKGGRDSTLELTAKTPRLRLAVRGSPDGVEDPTARAVRLAFGVSADLTRPIEPRSGRAQVKLEVPDLRWLNGALEREALFTHGSSQADVDLRWSKEKPGGGTIALAAEEARFALADNVLQVSGTADAQVTYDGANERGMFDKLEVQLPQVAVKHDDEWKPLPRGLQARAERFRWQGEPPRRMQGRFSLDADEIEPFLPFVISSSILRTVAKVLVSLGKTHAVVELDRTPEALELRLEEARSAKLRVFGILRSEPDVPEPCGRFFLQNPMLNFGIELHRGETSIEPLVSPEWWRERPPTVTCGPGFNPPKQPKQARRQTPTLPSG